MNEINGLESAGNIGEYNGSNTAGKGNGAAKKKEDNYEEDFENNNDENALRDLDVHPRKKNINISNGYKTPTLKEFKGEWLYWDDSNEVKEWLVREISVEGDEFIAYDTPPNKRSPGRGYVYKGQVYIYFPDEKPYRRHRPVNLVDMNTIRFLGDPDFEEWIRKGSSKDPYEKFEEALKIKKDKPSRDILAAIKSTRSPEKNLIGEGQFRSVAKEWVLWVAVGELPWTKRLVDDAADIMQNVPRLVRYLSLQLSREYQLDEKFTQIEFEKKVEPTPDNIREATKKVHRRIAALFAEMSDRKNFDGKPDKPKFDDVRAALLHHAVPIIVAKLPTEEDLETRRSFATVLGNLREDITIDALVTSLVSDQQVRASRQKMIADYYLQPSKQQSDEASEILKGAVLESKRTLGLLQWLNVIIFLAGIFILVGGLYISFTNKDARVAGALVSLGGFAGVITLLVNDPLNRIQNSLSNLVQLEAAFTSFIWELNLNSTFIQSQYVAKGFLDQEDVAPTLSRIEDAMDFTMTQVATYTDEGREVLVPYLTHISSLTEKDGDIKVQIHGNHLKAGAKTKEKDAADLIRVTVNHAPLFAIEPSTKSNILNFVLKPEHLPKEADGGNIWIALIINGYETNALPLNVRAASHPSEVKAQVTAQDAGDQNLLTVPVENNQPAEQRVETVPSAP